jgi:molybdopterin/thiamine biosynthesis adenylyltransferase
LNGYDALSEDFERYLRQLEMLGLEGQRRLRKARVVIAGVGGLGSVVSMYLVAAGVGRVILFDSGTLELNNLNRQIIYTEEDLGTYKVAAAVKRLKKLNSEVEVIGYAEDVRSSRFREEVSNADLIIDCLDNWVSRIAVDKVSWELRKPLIHGGISEFYGQVTTVVPGITKCLRCILNLDEEKLSTSPERPPQVIGPTPGVVGSIEAAEAIKLITGVGELLTNKLLIIDLKRHDFTLLKLSVSDECQC